VVSTEWENTIPLTSVAGQKEQVPTLYKIPNLADHVYLVLDGQRVVRLETEAGRLPGHVPTKDFTLERFGSRLRGNLVFEVPATGPLGAAELRFYDFAHGHMALRSTPTPPSRRAQAARPAAEERGRRSGGVRPGPS
jgi:hypothetical protein